jgi:preprotein translocase SecE subunit
MTHRGVSTKHSRFRFIGETIAELKKVVWLTRREAAYLTFLVLVVSIAVGIILGVTDLGFYNLVNKFFLPSP